MCRESSSLASSRYSRLRELSELIRERWILEMRSRQTKLGLPARYRPGAKVERNWEKVAAFFLDNGIPIVPFIRYVVHQMPVPQANHLKSQKVFQQFRESEFANEAKIRQIMKTELESQRSIVFSELSMIQGAVADGILEEEVTPRAAIMQVLGNEVLSLSPLFRYCWACEQNFMRVAENYKAEAMMQYTTYPKLYDEIWGEWIPEDFREEARGR